MKFFEWTTDYSSYKKYVPREQQDEYPIFYRERERQIRKSDVIPVRLWSENQWRTVGEPYYNIHPRMVSKLCRVDLSKIPSTMLKMPHNLPVVNIRFSQQHEEFTFHEELQTDNRSKTGSPTGTVPPGSFCHGVLMFDNRNSLEPLLPSGIFFLMDFDVYTSHNQPVYSTLGIFPREGKDLETIMHDQTQKRYDGTYEEMLRNIMRLTVTIGFLADNPAVCEADVLSKDKPEFQRTQDESRRKTIAERARRRGKLGYNIGHDMMFLGERAMGSKRGTNVTGRELEWAHIRGGRAQAVRYGTGKKLVKIMWFPPTTVRDDLPFKPE